MGQTILNGYDPDAMRERYQSCVTTIDHLITGDKYLQWCANNPTQAEKTNYQQWRRSRILEEMRTRTPEWLFNGTASPIVFNKPKRDVKPHEMAICELLSSQGFKGIVLRAEARPKRTDIYRKSVDAIINGCLWEFKTLFGTSIKAIEKCIRKAKKQCLEDNFKPKSPPRSVLDARDSTIEEQELINEVDKRFTEFDFVEALLIYGDDQIRRFRKE